MGAGRAVRRARGGGIPSSKGAAKSLNIFPSKVSYLMEWRRGVFLGGLQFFPTASHSMPLGPFR